MSWRGVAGCNPAQFVAIPRSDLTFLATLWVRCCYWIKFMFTVLGFLAQVCVICVSIALFVDMHTVVSAEHDALVGCVSLPQVGIVDDVHESNATLSDTVTVECLSYDELDYLEFNQAQSLISCAKVMASPAIVIVLQEFEPYPADINSMTVKQLKAYAKSAGFAGYSSLRKAELVALLSEF